VPTLIGGTRFYGRKIKDCWLSQILLNPKDSIAKPPGKIGQDPTGSVCRLAEANQTTYSKLTTIKI
jgi:hypothetical protein